MNETVFLIAIVMNIGCTIACAFVSKSKGRSMVAGAAAGFFLGFIGLLIVILQSPIKYDEY